LRYSLLKDNVTSEIIRNETNRYIYHVYRIRFFIARAHSWNVFTIHSFSMYSMAVPMFLSFEAFSSGSIDFGGFMKMGAAYAGFQNAFLYIFTFYRSFYQGMSAVNRLLPYDYSARFKP
jgi:ABC-type uncharacterized transport system fused permease/ATPase subunit